jgi:transposase
MQEPTPNPALTAPQTPGPVAGIGWDWADTHHDLFLETAAGQTERVRLAHEPGQLHQWLKALGSRFSQQKVALCLEATRSALLPILLAYPFWELYLVNPKSLARFRQVMRPSGSKSDALDCRLACQLVKSHASLLNPHVAQDALTLELEQAVTLRRGLVDARTALANQLGRGLKSYFPLALVLVQADTTTALAAALVLRFPTLQALQAASLHQVRQFFLKHKCRLTKGLEERLTLIAPAQPVSAQAPWNHPQSFLACTLAQPLAVLIKRIDQLEERIRILAEQHPHHALVASLPGAGPALEPRLAVALGTQPQACASAQALAVRSGVAPVRQQSGNTCLVTHRWAKPQFLHQTWIEYAKSSTLQCAWAQAFVAAKTQAGKSYYTAIRALAVKWMRILHACWEAGTVYDEAQYLAALKKHHSPYHPQT